MMTPLVMRLKLSKKNSKLGGSSDDTGRRLPTLSRGQQFVVDVGAALTLECEFYTDDFNLFDNPIRSRCLLTDAIVL